jgi:hypothetical membrane protein
MTVDYRDYDATLLGWLDPRPIPKRSSAAAAYSYASSTDRSPVTCPRGPGKASARECGGGDITSQEESETASSTATRWAALGGVVGPVVFVGTWLVAGLVKSGYSPLHDPISDLAGVHASTRPTMTAAFVVFAVGMCLYASALRAAGFGYAWISAAMSGVATLGVAAFPLHSSAAVDRVHGVFAGIGYVTLAATALASAAHLRRTGPRAWARLAAVCGVVSAVALALTLLATSGGLFQRLGLTAGDIWVGASAVALSRRRCLDRRGFVS